MILCMDCRWMNASGIGRYTRGMLDYFTQQQDIQLKLIIGEEDAHRLEERTNSQVEIISASSRMYSLKEQWLIPLKVPKCDVFWSLHYNVPILPIRARKRVVTIHDTYHLAGMGGLSVLQRLYAKTMISFAARASDRVLTVSEFSKGEIVRYTGTNPEKIKSAYNGIDRGIFGIREDKEEAFTRLHRKYGIPRSFILFIGNIKPNKNVNGLIKAFVEVSEALHEVALVIVGKRDHFIQGVKGLDKLITELGIAEKVIFTGYVEDEDLPGFYNLAQLFVFPSFYEGFGLPPLEAMACGCPAVVSDIPALREVCGDAAHYVDPYDPYHMAAGIYKVLDNSSLRQQLILKGLERAKQFSWEKAAEEVKKELDQMTGVEADENSFST